MSLQKLTFRKLPTVTNLAITGVNQALDLIYSGFASATYADGSARATGSARAWSPDREIVSGLTQAVFCAPPTSGNALKQRVIFAGSTGAASPTMLRDTYSSGTVYVGISTRSDNYGSWRNALPYNTGIFGGFTQFLCSGMIRNTQFDFLNIWESSEAFMIQALTSPDSSYATSFTNGMAYCGAICDPESTNTTVDSEDDGRLYGIAVGGNLQSANGNTANILYSGQGFGSTNPTVSTSYMYSWSTAASSITTSNPLFYCLVPGAGANSGQALFASIFNNNTHMCQSGSLYLTRSSQRGQVPLLAANSRAATFTPGFPSPSFMGRIRETDMCLGPYGNDVVIRDSGNNILGYSISEARNSNSSVSLFLPYA